MIGVSLRTLHAELRALQRLLQSPVQSQSQGQHPAVLVFAHKLVPGMRVSSEHSVRIDENSLARSPAVICASLSFVSWVQHTAAMQTARTSNERSIRWQPEMTAGGPLCNICFPA